ncbi:MAG TPA: helix-turn-helix domain-containing GNAT family N-acetyltransferase [Bryobacteraceae bacterium]|nr:helix-turn-helix domain-containing GNAT family N-acetyltransferase [Bryobacteraceae bacterium]
MAVMAAAQYPTLVEEISVFRRFNRGYTKFLGTLNEGMLDSEHTLTQARVLYELATRSAPTAREIGDELSLDSGYLSRLLRDFERGGLVRKKTSEKDGRFAELTLTKLGMSAFKKLDSLSNEHAAAALEKLSPEGIAEVVRCMQSIERLLIQPHAERRPWILRPPRPGDMGWVVHREGAGYAEQYGFDQTFEALVARIVHDFVANYDPTRERCWIAEVDGQNVGHIFLVKHPEVAQTAKLRLLFVEASARGLGIGNALVNECIRFARLAGYKRVVLWTQSILTAAKHIYQKAGFRLVKAEPHHSFGQDLIGQEWELDLI